MTKNLQKEFDQTVRFLQKKSRLSPAMLQNLVRLCWHIFPHQRQDHLRSVLLVIAAWIVVVDKFYESRKTTNKQLRTFRSRVIAVLSDQPSKAHRSVNPFSVSFLLFVRMRDTVLEGDSSKFFARRWKTSIIDFLDGMEHERYHKLSSLPSLSSYLRNGRKSIGSDVALYALLISPAREKSSPSPVKFGIIRKVIKEASLLLRLANDLGSSQRERKQKKVNSVVIVQKRLRSDKRAKFFINQMINQKYKALRSYQGAVERKYRSFTSAVLRIIDYNVALYRVSDYHKRT